MSKLKVIHPVPHNGKDHYTIDADILPHPMGYCYRAQAVVTPAGLVPLTLVPFHNVASITIDATEEYIQAIVAAANATVTQEEDDNPEQLTPEQLWDRKHETEPDNE